VLSGPQWTTDGSNELEIGTPNATNGKRRNKGNNKTTKLL